VTLSIVPTRRVRATVANMVRDVDVYGTAADAVLRHLPDIRADEIAAVLSLTVQIAHDRVIPDADAVDEFTRAGRKAHAAFARGDRSAAVVRGERAYQAERKRVQRRGVSPTAPPSSTRLVVLPADTLQEGASLLARRMSS
jgi:hypothetical protein